ncbi:MAG TPA: hypothetical protein DD435_17205 [Cyanobacteria bacterium UBA8530]|nr:hypothetical protein [Cyanobacteria bacterium UBA8530]
MKKMNSFDREISWFLEKAKKLGVEAEAYASSGKSFKVQAFQSEIEDFLLSESAGIGIRVVDGSRNGYAYTENLSRESVEAAVEEAAENVKLVTPDKGIALDNPPAPPALDLYTPALAEVDVTRKIQLAKDLEKKALAVDPRIKNIPYADCGDSEGLVRIANTKGLDRSYSANLAWIACGAVAELGGETQSAYKVKASRRFEDLEKATIAEKAAREAVAKLGALEVNSGDYPVVFVPEAFCEILETFVSIFSARMAQEGKSPLKGRLGETIGNPVVSLIDDPLMNDGFSSRPFDDEGTPSKKLAVVEAGKFLSFFHNSQSARIDGVESTGHASRSSYRSAIGISPSNLYLVPGKTDPCELKKDCLVVTEVAGMHSGANPVSGDFSLSAQGFRYSENEETYPIKNFTVSGNFLSLLASIEALGNDLEFFPSGVGTPTVRIKELAIAGK